jgi:hypothetical protein
VSLFVRSLSTISPTQSKLISAEWLVLSYLRLFIDILHTYPWSDREANGCLLFSSIAMYFSALEAKTNSDAKLHVAICYLDKSFYDHYGITARYIDVG